MAGRIPQQFIDELVTRADIVELIDARVPLKKRGKEYIACCPFHNEKSPSFTVSPDKQFYHCFGCGAHGTALGFLMEYERLDFVEAIEALAESLHLEVPREGGHSPARAQHHDLYDLLEHASQWFQQQLKTTPEAIAYLKQRGLSGQTAADFGVGFAPERWDALLTHLGGDAAAERLLQAGLIIKRDNGGYYDRFRQRIMFPIRDRRGRAIAFGGRIIGDGEPKYLNSPETPTFHKGQELYGLYEARKAPGNLTQILVVEGYMDVIALAQHGVRNAVATLGTATTRDHLERLFRVVPRVIFCFDGDPAGRKAAWRALENALPLLRDGLEAYFLFLPDGEDPDSLIRSDGAEAFQSRVAHAIGLSEFLIDELKARHQTDSREGRASLAESAKGLLKDLSPGLLREQVLQALAHVVNLDVDKLSGYFTAPTDSHPPLPSLGRQSNSQIQMTPVRLALALLLLHPSLALSVRDLGTLANVELPGMALLIQLLETLQDEPDLTTAAVIERWRGREEQRHLLKLAQWQAPDSDEPTLKKTFEDAIDRLHSTWRQQRMEQLLYKARTDGLLSEEKSEFQALLTGKA